IPDGLSARIEKLLNMQSSTNSEELKVRYNTIEEILNHDSYIFGKDQFLSTNEEINWFIKNFKRYIIPETV
ncbi:MAG: hypothetical protein WD512_01515, partial [Candidatus Paceibacterota bacterium]